MALTIHVPLDIPFLAMRNRAFRETQLVEDALDSIAALLPASWRLDRHPSRSSDNRRFDAIIELTGPTEKKAAFVVEAKRSASASLLIPALRELQRASEMPVLFVSDYIGPALRDALITPDQPT